MTDLKQSLRDFVATANSGKYADENVLISKFPELKGYDIGVLKDFVATSNSGKYQTEDELFSKFPEFAVKKKELVSPSQQKAQPTSLVTGGAMEGGPSVPSVNPPSNKLQEELFQKSRLAASAFVNPMKPGYTPVPEAEAKKAFYGKANVEAGTLRGIPGERKSTINNLNDKYKDLGVQFEEIPGKLQKSFGLGDIVVTADDGSTHIVQSTGADEKLKEEEAKLQTFLMSKSAGAEKKEVTPIELLRMSQDGISDIEKNKFKRVYTPEMINETVKFVNDEVTKSNKKLQDINNQIQQVNNEAARLNGIMGSATTEDQAKIKDLTDRYDLLISEFDREKNNAQVISRLGSEGINMAAGEHVKLLEQQGSFGKSIYNHTINAIGDAVNGVFQLASLGVMDKGAAYAQDLTNQFKEEFKYAGTEVYEENSNMAMKVLFSMPEWLPMAAMAPEVAMAYMFSQGVGRRMEEVNSNEETKSLSQAEKLAMVAPMAYIEAQLEKLGFGAWFNKNKGLASSIVLKAVSNVSPKAGAAGITKLINTEINNLAVKGLLNVSGAMLAEAETESLQYVTENAMRELYNVAEGRQIFKQPQFGSEAWAKELSDNAIMGAMGASFVSGPINIAQQTANYVVGKSNTNQTFGIVKDLLNDNVAESSMITQLNAAVNDGKLSKEKAQNTLYNFREAKAIARDLPEGLSEDNQRAAFDLLAEKRKLTKQIEGKDPSLVNKQKKRITEIENQLIDISNAVQEQTTSEVPVQPEARVGEEVVEGKPQPEPEVVTEEGAAKKEEVKSDIEKRRQEELDSVDVSKGGKIPLEGYEEFYNKVNEKYDAELASLEQQKTSPKDDEVAQQYIADLQETKQSDPEQYWSVDSVTEEAAKEGTVITDEDGGVVVSKDGDIKGLFKKAASKAKGVAQKLLQKAVEAGGIKLDNFDNYLTPVYEKAGFRVVSRLPFNEEYAPEGWNKEKHGTPDVVAMVYDPQNKLDIQEQKFEDYDEAMAYRDQLVEQSKSEYPMQSNFDQAVNKSAQALNVVAPDLKVIVGDNIDDVQNRIVEAIAPLIGERQAVQTAEEFATGTKGQTIFVDGKPFAVVFDKTTADSRTAGHEAWEVMLNDAFGNDQAKFKEFTAGIDSQLRAQGFADIADALDAFASQKGYEAVKYSEYMAELGGMLVEAGFGKGPLTAQQKTLLQKIGDIINKFAELFTGKKQFLDQATPEDILGFMVTISEKVAKGEDVSRFFRKGEKAKATEGVTSKSQMQAIEILDGPKFDNKLKEDVASYLNGLRDSEIPPNSSRELLMERFINNVYEEVGYYLYSKPDARSAGLTWYIEDMVEFENKIKVVLPELSNENQYKLFLTVLAFTSSGTNPNQNLLYAYNLWNNSKDPKNFEFSKTWGESKLSFIDKKGKSIASGIIVKETAKEYTVELIDSLGRPVVDKKGNKKYEKISKNSMKEGYPKSTGYTNRGEIIIGQLEKLEKIYKDLGSIDKVVKWLESPHPISELRKYNQSVPDVNGKGPGETNKEYDPKKNAEGERNGAFIFGEKIGSFYQNMIGIGETITMDLWWSRTWNRYMGTMINTVSGKKEIQEVPRSDRERNIMREAVKLVAEDLNLQVSELQAAIWYFEQELWTKSGNKSPSYSYVTAIDDLTKKLKVDEETRTKLRAAEADLTEAEKRRQNAAERAAAVVASKGGEIPGSKVTSRSQKSVPTVVDEVLTDDGKGNYLFVHYSRAKRDTIKPMSGSKENFTSREEVAAISSVGGVAMYYTKAGQKEQGVGNVPHTVLVPKDKVYFYGTTERGKVSNDPENFYPEARRRFQEYKNMNNPTRPTEYAFDSNNAAAWITKVAAENGYDMVVTNWGGPKSYRAQTVKELTPEAEYTGFKEIPDAVFEVGDEIFVNGSYGNVTSVSGSVVKYEGTNRYGNAESGGFDLNRPNNAIMIEKAKPSVTTRSQKVEVKTIPGYDRMLDQVEGIMDKTMNSRNGSYNKATANSIDYIQKSLVYINADDSQREQIIRDFKKIRGEKFKVAPSVAKIMGQIKDVKQVTVKESTALKDQIKLEAKAAKDSAAFVKQLRMDISNQLKSMVGRGMMSARQATAIISRYDKMNILNPVMRDRFVDYMSRVFQSAEYTDKIKEASKLRKTIRKAAKNPNNQADNSKLAKAFAEIDPSRVENIDDYLNNAEQILKSVSRTTGDVKMRSLVNMTDMVSYIDKEIQEQRKQIKNEILSKYQDLVDAGVLDSKMTINEIQKVVDSIKETEDESEAKAQEAKAAVKQMMEELSPILIKIARTGEDPFTGDPIDLTSDEKRDLVKLANMDIDSLSLADSLKAVEYANNFISNGIFSGIGAIVSINEGSLEPAKLKKEGVMSLRLRKYFSPGAGRKWAEQLGTLTLLNKLLFLSNEKAIMVANASGESGIANGKAKAIKIVEKAVKEYTDKFSSLKDFRTGENIIERGILAFVSRTVIGDKFQAQDEFNRRKTLIEETIQALKDPNNSTDADIKKGELIEKVYDKTLKNAKNVKEVRANTSEVNKKAVDWWVNEWSKHYERMDEVSRSVYNTLLTRDANFTPDRFQSIDLTTASENDFDSSFFGSFENVSTDKSGSLKENRRIKNLPSDKNGAKTRIVNLDFDMNNANALTNALIDVETASSVLKAKGFVTSKDFGKIFSSKDDAKLYKRRLISYVNNVRGKNYVDQSELTNMGKSLNAIGSFGTAKALFSLSQPIKQSIPPLFNTLVQTGRLDLGTLFSGGSAFIDRTGYPIINRGISSLAELQAINKKVAEAEKNLLAKGIMGIAEYNNKMLEIWLQKPDVFTARSSWLSFYINSLKKQGINTKGLDWNTHEVNKKAADYAELMVSSQQNVNDSDMQGMLFTNKTPYAKAVRKALFTLMTFTLNQKTRIWSDMRTLSNKKLTSESDRKEALLSLAGAIVELVSFHSISLGVSYIVLQPLIDAMMEALGYEDDDEDKELENKKLLMNKSASIAQSFLKDFILPPIPGIDALASSKVNSIMEEYGISEKIAAEGFGMEEGESKFELYDKQDYSFLDVLGGAGIAAEKGKELFDFTSLASTGKFDLETKGGLITKQIQEENEDLAKINASIMSAYYLGILPGELAYIARKLDKKIKKGAERVEEDED